MSQHFFTVKITRFVVETYRNLTTSTRHRVGTFVRPLLVIVLDRTGAQVIRIGTQKVLIISFCRLDTDAADGRGDVTEIGETAAGLHAELAVAADRSAGYGDGVLEAAAGADRRRGVHVG